MRTSSYPSAKTVISPGISSDTGGISKWQRCAGCRQIKENLKRTSLEGPKTICCQCYRGIRRKLVLLYQDIHGKISLNWKPGARLVEIVGFESRGTNCHGIDIPNTSRPYVRRVGTFSRKKPLFQRRGNRSHSSDDSNKSDSSYDAVQSGVSYDDAESGGDSSSDSSGAYGHNSTDNCTQDERQDGCLEVTNVTFGPHDDNSKTNSSRATPQPENEVNPKQSKYVTDAVRPKNVAYDRQPNNFAVNRRSKNITINRRPWNVADDRRPEIVYSAKRRKRAANDMHRNTARFMQLSAENDPKEAGSSSQTRNGSVLHRTNTRASHECGIGQCIRIKVAFRGKLFGTHLPLPFSLLDLRTQLRVVCGITTGFTISYRDYDNDDISLNIPVHLDELLRLIEVKKMETVRMDIVPEESKAELLLLDMNL